MNQHQKPKTFKEAKQIVFRLLKLRLRSQKEVQDKLILREFDQPTIDQTLDYFRGINFINDEVFARQWIESRALRPFGINRIRFELREKGIAEDIVSSQLEIFKNEISEEDVVCALANRRRELIKEKDLLKVKSRLYGYLLRKGFNTNTVLKVLNKL